MTSLTDIPVSLDPIVDGKGDLTVTIEDIFSSSDESVTSGKEKQVVNPNGGISETRHNIFTPLISERAVDQPRPLKVIYIGAGISGILAAIKFREAVPDLNLTIYEKNPELGGTWYENQYPGCACDVPSHVYQLSFESWTGWSQFFSGADEIREYWNRVAQKYNVRDHIKFQSRCVGARWNDATGKWFVQILDEKTGSVFEDSADVFMTGTGLLNEWKWPSIPGLQSFKGELLHSACWNSTYDMKDKSIAVIGAGSSGIQIVPALLDKVKSMDHYVRSKTWISNQHGGEVLSTRTNGKGGNFAYSSEEKQAWQSDPTSYVEYRKGLELQLQTLYSKTQTTSALQASSRAQYQADMERRLKDKPELLGDLLPDFPPLCKRLTPGPGYLEALTSPKVNVITIGIDSIEDTGVITSCGTHRAVDAIVCATGFETNPGGGFPIIGRHGVNLREKYRERPETYLGITTNGFPNFFQSLGPNSFQGAGNLLITMEQVHTYVAEIVSRMAYDNIGLVEPKESQVQNFTRFCDKYFERTVYSAECASWYKSSPPGSSLEERKRGRVTALWPGSSLHALKTLKKVRWEDYNIQSYDGNDFGWFGNGWVLDELKPQIDSAALIDYLDRTEFVDEVDTKSIHDA
ncbi:FAD-dependent pyridine nucleotide-disulfide oxidoreductase [Penicillium griseofulvum]|uniref:FAD-dependent pyridine nucleotide-disulfide oxidoreductase n=1 Tax=Penicillium patulum TaxID=5078 RepID=A0A135LGE3_PENPA|nr:FAD-dependent pyridine nucleotide-disulfide oxidoreductase [Penicillium griseofulvum]KXG48029.1 FAD-dependent pyridine nucleotide-disulfide oxidoreductase [Penicillium griseofulvum]